MGNASDDLAASLRWQLTNGTRLNCHSGFGTVDGGKAESQAVEIVRAADRAFAFFFDSA